MEPGYCPSGQVISGVQLGLSSSPLLRLCRLLESAGAPLPASPREPEPFCFSGHSHFQA